MIDRISKELFDTFRSLGIAPILKISEDDKLTVRIQQKLVELFKDGRYESKFKPLLMLFNRKNDIQSMFYHSWKYIGLIQDIFGILGNQFTLTENGKNELCELDFNTDDILQ